MEYLSSRVGPGYQALAWAKPVVNRSGDRAQEDGFHGNASFASSHRHDRIEHECAKLYSSLQQIIEETPKFCHSQVVFQGSRSAVTTRLGRSRCVGLGTVLTWLSSSAQGRFPEPSPHVLCCARSLFSPERLKSQVHLFYFPILRLLQMFAGKHQCQSIFWSLSMILRIPVLYILYSESRGNAGAHLKGKPGIL